MKTKLVLAGLLAGSALAAPAAASIQIDTYAGDPGLYQGNVFYQPTNQSINLWVGRFDLAGTDLDTSESVDFLTFCVDIFTNISTPGTFDIIPLAAFVADPVKQQNLLTLISYGSPLIATGGTVQERKDIAAGLQLAVWETLYETSGVTSLSNGAFRSYGDETANARAKADMYLASVQTSAWEPVDGAELRVLYSATNQSQVFLAAAAVPEPASWAMMIAGFGLVGGALRSNRRERAAVA